MTPPRVSSGPSSASLSGSSWPASKMIFCLLFLLTKVPLRSLPSVSRAVLVPGKNSEQARGAVHSPGARQLYLEIGLVRGISRAKVQI